MWLALLKATLTWRLASLPITNLILTYMIYLLGITFHSMTEAVNKRSHLESTLLVFFALFLDFKMLLKKVRLWLSGREATIKSPSSPCAFCSCVTNKEFMALILSFTLVKLQWFQWSYFELQPQWKENLDLLHQINLIHNIQSHWTQL